MHCEKGGLGRRMRFKTQLELAEKAMAAAVARAADGRSHDADDEADTDVTSAPTEPQTADETTPCGTVVTSTTSISIAKNTDATRRWVSAATWKVMQDLRESGKACDAVMRVDGGRFVVHRTVMSNGSPFFKELFSGEASGRVEIRSPVCGYVRVFVCACDCR